MNLDLEIEFSKAPILQEIDALKKQIDDMRPLPADVEGRVMQKLRLDWNYNSNAIEGNKLSYGETVAFLMEGITAKGKPLKDHLDIRGHNEAINFLLDLVKDSRPISEADIRALHKMILVEPYKVDAQTADGKPTTKTIKLGEYKEMSNHVKTATGETHYYATPDEVKVKMPELIEWYKEVNSYENIHPVVVAALFHHKFVAIHPFDDGNGRLSRILMNLILMQKGFPPAVIKMDDRKNYYSLLSRADNNDTWAFVEYILERVQNSLNVYLKAINGGDINEDEDIDKKIALFKIELQSKITPKKEATKEEINTVINSVILPFIQRLSTKLSAINEFFDYSIITVDTPLDGEIDNIEEFINKYDLIHDIQKGLLLNGENRSVHLCIQFIGFKNPDNIFDISTDLEIGFEDREYFIRDINNISTYKFFGETLSINEQNDIIAEVLDSLEYFINQNTED